MDIIVPPHIKLGARKDSSLIAPPADRLPDESHQRIVLAPVMHGRSFTLRWSYSPHFSTGQMLVLIDKERYGSPMEVVNTFFPMEKVRDTGRRMDRVYLGDRRLGKRWLASILEIKVVPGEPMTFRMLYPSGKEIHDWKTLDLSKIRLKTTDEQRAHITTFTGVIYKTQQAKIARQQEQNGRPHHSRPINRAMDDSMAKTLKKKIASAIGHPIKFLRNKK